MGLQVRDDLIGFAPLAVPFNRHRHGVQHVLIAKQIAQRPAHRFVVFDNENERVSSAERLTRWFRVLGHDASSSCEGRTNWTVVPGPSLGEIDRRPSCASTIERQIESPIPMPLDLVVKKALNSRFAISAEIPTPQSVTLTCTRRFSSWPDRITSSRCRSVIGCMASIPFITRLMITCCN